MRLERSDLSQANDKPTAAPLTSTRTSDTNGVRPGTKNCALSVPTASATASNSTFLARRPVVTNRKVSAAKLAAWPMTSACHLPGNGLAKNWRISTGTNVPTAMKRRTAATMSNGRRGVRDFGIGHSMTAEPKLSPSQPPCTAPKRCASLHHPEWLTEVRQLPVHGRNQVWPPRLIAKSRPSVACACLADLGLPRSPKVQ
jgi:hypothetical protein